MGATERHAPRIDRGPPRIHIPAIVPHTDATDLDLRLAYLGLTQDEIAVLGELRPNVEAAADNLVAAFYRHLLSFEGTRGFLADPEVKNRLLRSQREYLLSLFGTPVDDRYVEERIQIGRTHERIGLEPRWYLGAYTLYFSLLVPIIRDELHADLDRCEQAVAGLVKLLLLDAQLAMESYIERHESQLAHLNRELAEASRSLSRSLDDRNQELRQTSKRARAAEDLASVATLAAGLAHEIGTPMGVIQGHAEALEPKVDDEKSRWRLRTISEQVERVSRIIQALLNMARPRETIREPVELQPLLETTLGFLAVKLRRRAVKVETRFETAPSVLGDPEKLQQLFLNLALNAADAMEEGGGTLRVSVRPDRDDTVLTTFEDDGPGIPPEELERIFEPFFTTKPAGQGNGLGLMVAKGIVGDHGGTLEVESEPGRGTAFAIQLPRAATARQADGDK